MTDPRTHVPAGTPDPYTPEQHEDIRARDRATQMSEALTLYARGRHFALIASQHGDTRSAREARAQGLVALHMHPELAGLLAAMERIPEPEHVPYAEPVTDRETATAKLRNCRATVENLRDSTLPGTPLFTQMQQASDAMTAAIHDLEQEDAR